MVSADDDRRPRGPYALGMQLLRQLGARVRAIDPLRADVLLAALFAVESQLELFLFHREGADHVWLASLLLLAMAVGLGLRRVQPLAAVVLSTGSFAAI